MEVSPKELMDILNKIISKRKGPGTLVFDLWSFFKAAKMYDLSELICKLFLQRGKQPKKVPSVPSHPSCVCFSAVEWLLRLEPWGVTSRERSKSWLTQRQAQQTQNRYSHSACLSLMANGWPCPFQRINAQIKAIKSYLQHVLTLVPF